MNHHQHGMQHRHVPQPRHRSPHPTRSGRVVGDGDGLGLDGAPASIAAVPHTGHIIQSRTATQAHALTKRARSRSKSRRRQQELLQAQQEQEAYHFKTGRSSSFLSDEEDAATNSNDNNISMANRSTSVGRMRSSGKITERGRCTRHPDVELCVRDSTTSQWRVLLQDCPQCSLEDSNTSFAQSSSWNNNSNHRISNNGNADRSLPSTKSTKTNRTITTEESSVKSWTMSDGSDSEDGGEGGRRSRAVSPTAEMLFKPQPPPPRAKRSSPHQQQKQQQQQHQQHIHRQQEENMYQHQMHQQQEDIYQQKMQQQQQTHHQQGDHVYQHQINEHQRLQKNLQTVKSLKQLGRQLITETEQQQHQQQNTWVDLDDQNDQQTARRMFPPPPPARPPPPRRGNEVLGEADDIMAQMERSLAEPKSLSRRQLRRQQQQHPQYTVDESAQPDEESRARAAAAAVSAAALADEEKRQRAQRRREKAERKAARNRARELRHQQQQGRGRSREDGAGETFELPMNDTIPRPTVTRGRDEGRTDDILQAAAQIRARARRSTSRSRERVRDAAIFCGELPAEDDENVDEEDQLTQSSEKRRSILNPHGLAEPPRAPAVERRSQSRDRRGERERSKSKSRKSKSRSRGGGRLGHDEDSHGRGKRSGSRGRHQERDNYGDQQYQQRQSNAEEMLNRRREMRQKIAERQNRTRQGRAGSGNLDSLAQEEGGGWPADYNDVASTANSRSGRSLRRGGSTGRGRSRSRVREGLSKIRSSSLFGKKRIGGETLVAEEERTTYSAHTSSSKKSTSSFKKFLSKGRSRSRGRLGRSPSANSQVSDEPPGGWDALSQPSPMHGGLPRRGSFNGNQQRQVSEFDNRSLGARSELNTKSSRGASLGIFKRKGKSNSGKKSKGMGGMVRSLSRGNLRGSSGTSYAAGEFDYHSQGFGDSMHSWDALRSESADNPRTSRAYDMDYNVWDV